MMAKTKTTELTFCAASLFASGPFCATGGLEDLRGGAENACVAAATRPTLYPGAWSLLPAALEELPGLLLAWFIPASNRRDAAAGFFAIARWAAVATAAPDVGSDDADAPGPGVVLAWLIPATSRRDAAAGFFAIARWAAEATAAPGVCASEGAVPALPVRARRSGLEVKYLQERASEDRRCGPWAVE
jgi:hypothetical protein